MEFRQLKIIVWGYTGGINDLCTASGGRVPHIHLLPSHPMILLCFKALCRQEVEALNNDKSEDFSIFYNPQFFFEGKAGFLSLV